MLAGAVDKKQIMPILSNLLVRIRDNRLYLTATDLEIELTVSLDLNQDVSSSAAQDEQSFTLPAKKFLDLLKNLDDDETFDVKVNEHHLVISTESTQFKFFTLPPDDFPLIQLKDAVIQLSLPRQAFIQLMQTTAFAISQQDVRVFLNGLLLEFNSNRMVAVAADGHRMAITSIPYEHPLSLKRLILPRRSVTELLRLLPTSQEEEVKLTLYPHLLTIEAGLYHFTTKLIDAQFLPYHQAIPKQFTTYVLVERDVFKRALSRTLIIAIDKSRPVILEVSSHQLSLLAQNQEKEQAVENMPATVDGAPLRIGINPYYLLDVLSIFSDGLVRLSLSTPDSSVLVETLKDENYQYILMPMKL